MPTSHQDHPAPPRRLVNDHALRRFEVPSPAWEGRRASKMRERFPTFGDNTPMASMTLVMPVQPTLDSRPFNGAI